MLVLLVLVTIKSSLTLLLTCYPDTIYDYISAIISLCVESHGKNPTGQFLLKQCFLALKNIAAMFFTKDFHKVCYPSASNFVDCDCTQVRPQHRTNIWNYVEHKCIISVNKEKLTKAKCCVLVELLHNTKYNIIKAISNSSMSFYSIQSFTKTLWHLL